LNSNEIILGPLLGRENNQLSVSILLHEKIETKNLTLTCNTIESTATYYCQLNKYYFYRFEIKEWNTSNTYTLKHLHEPLYTLIDEQKITQWHFKDNKTTLAFSSCNGTSSINIKEYPLANYQLWEHLCNNAPDTLILCGDQVYADEAEEIIETILAKYNATLSTYQDNNNELQNNLDIFFEQLYIDSWGKAPIRHALASIPHIMTWDDHDIIDGYGSLTEKKTNSTAYKILSSRINCNNKFSLKKDTLQK
jgi:phosphodiesterase/alkaline phosphatase D-like protein